MALTANFYATLTASTPVWTVSYGMVATVFDTKEAQTIRVAQGGKLNWQAITNVATNTNTVILDGVKRADCYVYASITAVVIYYNGVEILDTTALSNAHQSIVFGGDNNTSLDLYYGSGGSGTGAYLGTRRIDWTL